MKTTRKQKVQKAAAELMKVSKARIAAEKREKELKELLKRHLEAAGGVSLKAGNFLIVLAERSRTDLDQDALRRKLGKAFESFQRQTTYVFIEVKPAA